MAQGVALIVGPEGVARDVGDDHGLAPEYGGAAGARFRADRDAVDRVVERLGEARRAPVVQALAVFIREKH